MARLLHGMTDALTPVNLLPNSDFSRGGVYTSTQTFNSLNQNNSVYLANDIILRALYGNFKNITVTRSRHNLTITGTYNGGASSSKLPTLRLEIPIYQKANIIQTYVAEYTKGNNVNAVSFSSSGSKNWYYNKPGKDIIERKLNTNV